jgi:hypothetical protein
MPQSVQSLGSYVISLSCSLLLSTYEKTARYGWLQLPKGYLFAQRLNESLTGFDVRNT